MKVGLIGRATIQGLGYQTLNFFNGFKPDSVLLLRAYNPNWAEYEGWYPSTTPEVIWNPHNGFQDKRPIHRFLSEVDAVFTVETLYDWDLANLAHKLGVKTVVQGNPEFYRHAGVLGSAPHPTQWTWPTPWMTEHLPPGPIIPVPATGRCAATAAAPGDGTFTITHVCGHRAAGDRNGTELFMEALRFLQYPTHARVYGVDGVLPSTRLPPHVTMEQHPNGVKDRWTMYDGAHALVMPRRYGGLCLPVQEAMEAGLAVMMTACSPNGVWPTYALPAAIAKQHVTPFGAVPTWIVKSKNMAREIDMMNVSHELLGDFQCASRRWVERNSWANLRPVYQELFDSL